MTIKVLSVREADGGGGVLITFEISDDPGETASPRIIPGRSASAARSHSERRTLLLTLADFRLHRVSRGDTVKEFEFDEMSRLSDIARATRRGAGILAYGANSEQNLRRKLIARGHSKESACAAVDELAAGGLINEPAAARRLAERCVQDLRGKTYIRSKLRSLGYRNEAISAANEYLDSVDFSRLCAEAIEKKYGGRLPDDRNERSRAIASLVRRGFTSGEVYAAMKKTSGRAAALPDIEQIPPDFDI